MNDDYDNEATDREAMYRYSWMAAEPDRTCPCEVPDEERDFYSCRIHVMCDDACGALVDPLSREDLELALDHWKYHSSLNGCSHGC